MTPDAEPGPNVHRIRTGVVDAALVLDAIVRDLGHRAVTLTPRETLAPRIVYEAALDDGRDVIFKAEVDAGGDDAIVLEAWAMERAAEAGVPVSRVLALDASAARFPGRYAIFERARGLPLAPVWRAPEAGETSLRPEALRQVLRTAGAHLRRLHAIPVAGYGRLDDERYLATGEVRGRLASWREAVLDPALAALAYMEPRRHLSPAEAAAVRTIFETHAAVLTACDDTRLLHGDLGAKHLYVDPGTEQLTAIIDFGDREAGDPAFDVAGLLLWEDESRLAWLCEGYGDAGPDFDTHLRVYALAEGLRLAHKRYAAGRIDAADPVVRQLLPRLAALMAGT